MYKKISALLLTIAMLFTMFAFTSCTEENGFPVNAAGIIVEAEPENIVVLNKNLADIIYCIGFDEKIAGRCDEVNQKGMHVVPSVGASDNVSVKKIKKLKADVVFADEALSKSVISKLKKAGIPTAVFKDVEKPEQIKKTYINIGAILGGNKDGKSLGKKAFEDLYEDLKDVKGAVDEKNVVKTIGYIYSDNGKLKTVNGSSWKASLLEFTGATNIFKNSKSDALDVSELSVANPDFIFCGDMEVVRRIRNSKRLKNLKASKKDIHIIALDEISMQGETSLYALEKMLRKMYPEDFR